MSRTVIDVDDQKLREAAEILGTHTKVETVNRALAEVVAQSRRMDLLVALDEGTDLYNPDVMKGAWRE